MIEVQALANSMHDRIKIVPASNGSFRVIAPFFHEDGDMVEIFLCERDGGLQLCDYGTTLMRLSYRFDVNTENKNKILSRIIVNSGINDDRGNLFLSTTTDTFFDDLMQYQMAVTKVSSMDMLRKEYVSSMFFEYFCSFILEDLGKSFSRIVRSHRPTGEVGFETDFAILDNPKKPVYIMGIRSDLHASRAAAFCLRIAGEPGRPVSIAVHESQDSLSKRDRDALTNAVLKQYTTLDEFKCRGQDFIMKNIA